MKNLFLNLFALLLIGASFSSCQKDSPADQNPELADAFFSVMLNDQAFVAEDFMAYAFDLDDEVTITGLGDLEGEEAVVISLPRNVSAGTFTMNDDVYAIVTRAGQAYITRWTGGQGQVVISSTDGVNYQGTFSFTAVNPDNDEEMVATEGKFDVNLRD